MTTEATSVQSQARPGGAPTLFTERLQLSRAEAAQLLNISLRTLDRLIVCKELAVRRVGRRVLITQQALAAFCRRDHVVQVS